MQGLAQLVGAGGAFVAAAYAVKLLYHVFGLHACDQAADALCVAVAASIEGQAFDDAVFKFEFYLLAAGALGMVGVFHC